MLYSWSEDTDRFGEPDRVGRVSPEKKEKKIFNFSESTDGVA